MLIFMEKLHIWDNLKLIYIFIYVRCVFNKIVDLTEFFSNKTCTTVFYKLRLSDGEILYKLQLVQPIL